MLTGDVVLIFSDFGAIPTGTDMLIFSLMPHMICYCQKYIGNQPKALIACIIHAAIHQGFGHNNGLVSA
jgi:hypothetical protein